MELPPTVAEALRLTRAGNLAEATARIRAALNGKLAPRPATRTVQRAAAPQHPAPQAGTFEPRDYASQAGTIGAMLYRPANAAPGMPLLVMLHGCTQSPEDFARGTAMNRLADELGFLVAYPRQTQAANAQKCWNWFRPNDQVRGRGEPALIASLTQSIIAAEHTDPARTYIAGLSAGGAAAAILANAYPDLYTAAGIHSGLACGAARDLPSALAAMKQGSARTPIPRTTGPRTPSTRFVPLITFHGDRDGTVHEINARNIVETATEAAGEPMTVELQVGTENGRQFTRALSHNAAGKVLIEQWTINGAGHAWSGGDASGTYVDPAGPDASRAMLGFFLGHSRQAN